MKLRWTSRSLRLRITPTELAALERGEPVYEHLRIPGAPPESGWRVALIPAAEQTDIRAVDAEVILRVGHADLARLSDPESEGVYFDRDGFTFYVEKDFPCVHPRAIEIAAGETGTETFAPPAGFDERKA